MISLFDANEMMHYQAVRLRWHYLEARRWIYLVQEREPRSCFIDEHYPNWDGGVDRWDREHPCLWHALADLMIAHQLPVQEWLETAMPRLETKGDPPPPNVLLDENIVAKARALRIDRQPQKLIQRRIQWESFLSDVYRRRTLHNLTERENYESCLIAPSNNWPPLFYFLVASKFGFTEVANQRAKEAFAEYACDQELLDEIWTTMVPAELRDATTELRADYAPLTRTGRA
jgi:hypothetical protein